jgi:hypothetical protein
MEIAPKHTIILDFQDRIGGDIFNAQYSVNLSSYLKNGVCRVYFKHLIFDDAFDTDDTAKNIWNLQIPELYDPNSYSTSTRGTTSTIITHKVNGYYETGVERPFYIDRDTLKCGVLNVRFSAPRWNLTAYTSNLPYPPAPMNASSVSFSNQPYGNGLYTASGPNRTGFWTSFDGNSNTGGTYWGGAYNAILGVISANFITTIDTGANIQGTDWDFKLPYPIILSHYSVQGSGDSCKSVSGWSLVGSSNNGTTWKLLDTKPQPDTTTSFELTQRTLSNNQLAFDYYRLVASAVGPAGSGGSCAGFKDIPIIAEVKYFGRRPLPFTSYSLALDIVDE